MLTSGCFLPPINTQGRCLLGVSQRWIRWNPSSNCCLSLGPNDLKTRFNKFCQIVSQPKPNNHCNKSQTQLPLAETSNLYFLFESHPAGRETGWNDSFYCQASKPSSLPRTCCHEAVNEWHVLSYSAPIRECAAFQKQRFPRSWMVRIILSHTVSCIFTVNLTQPDLESIFLNMIDWSFKKVRTEMYNDNIPKKSEWYLLKTPTGSAPNSFSNVSMWRLFCNRSYYHLAFPSQLVPAKVFSRIPHGFTSTFGASLYSFSPSTKGFAGLPLWRRRVSHPSRRVVRHSPMVIYPQTHNVEVIPVAGQSWDSNSSTLGLGNSRKLMNEL